MSSTSFEEPSTVTDDTLETSIRDPTTFGFFFVNTKAKRMRRGSGIPWGKNIAPAGKSTMGQALDAAALKLVCTRGQHTWVRYDR